VPDIAQAELSAVFFWGTDEGLILVPFIAVDRQGGEWDIYQATVQLVTKDDEGLKVLWLKIVGESSKKIEGVQQGPIEKELEKRMKARGQK
jgi:hypothetical protein